MRIWRPVFVLTIAAVGGCRGVPQPSTAPSVHTVQVGQLAFKSDFVLPADHRLVRDLAAERDDVSRTLGLPMTDEPIEVYLFSNKDRYREFLARYFPSVPTRRAFFLESDTSLSVYAHWSDRVAEDLRHEVAHGYLHAAVPNLPLWLDEGLAEFFEVPRGHGGLNEPHVQLLNEMMKLEQWRPDIARLESLTDAAQMQQIHYAEAWAWVYFMLQSSPENRDLLIGYLAEMRNHEQVEPLSARLAASSEGPQRSMVQFLASLSDSKDRVTGEPQRPPK